jgi:ribonuclease D
MEKESEQLTLPLSFAPACDISSVALPASISREELNALPIRSFLGQIVLVDNDEMMFRALDEICLETLLGFDTETKPVFKAGVSHPPALVQLAGEAKAWIFQLRKLSRLDGLFAIFGNTKIMKAGVALADDLKKLNELHPFKPEGFAEVGELARKLGYTQTGLRTLAGLVLGFRVSKREQRSNWARSQLTPAQINYAATDAWVSRELYIALTKKLADRLSNDSSARDVS